MKKLSLLISCLLVFLCTKSHAQAQWKFHLAFEDATGAKDTIWLIWDTSATVGTFGQIDSALGEDAFPFNYNEFNVWVYNYNNDSTKTQANPFTNILSIEIHAFNHQYPITISWDSSLFHSPDLPQPVGSAWLGNDYYFLVNNDPPSQSFNMLWDSSVIAPAYYWGAQSHFPLGVDIAFHSSVGINEINSTKKISVYPNPTSNIITIKAKEIKACFLLDNMGKTLLNKDFYKGTDYTLSVQDIPSGCYILKIINQNNEVYYEKVIIHH
ncbi:MAG: T9SS type A sorting domain-containing protein [Bacteroidia bacterium]|nr:T9SS type A sorting domain-containing protein [Bacteroidia bacterium]